MSCEYEYVVVIWGFKNILFKSKNLKECFEFLDYNDDVEDLVILYGEEDIPDDWEYM